MIIKTLAIFLLILITGCREDGSSSGFNNVGSGVSGAVSDSGGYADTVGGSSSGTQAHANPEPSSIILLGIGLAGLVASRLKKNKQR